MNSIAEYLKYKKVSFMLKTDYINKTRSFIGLTITKKDQFFRANGRVISKKVATRLLGAYGVPLVQATENDHKAFSIVS